MKKRSKSAERSLKKLLTKKRLIVGSSIAIGLVILLVVGIVVKGSLYTTHQNKITDQTATVTELQSHVDTLESVVTATSKLSKGTHGDVTLPSKYFFAGGAYTDQETKDWNECYATVDNFDKSLSAFRKNAALLSGDDQKIYNEWVKYAEVVGGYSYCYKSALYTSDNSNPTALESLENTNDTIQGRVIVLRKQLDTAKSDLKNTESSKYFLWW